MNVIDIKTRRPLGAPSQFVQAFEMVCPPLRRQHSSDVVSLIAIVRREVGAALFADARNLRRQSIEARRRLRQVVSLSDNQPLSGASSEADLPDVWFEPAPDVASDAWLLEATLTRENASRFARALREGGVAERRQAQELATG